MSLLLEALKRAERQKRERGAAGEVPPPREEPSSAPREAPRPPPAESALPGRELSLHPLELSIDEFSRPPADAEPSPSPRASATTADRSGAEQLFAAKASRKARPFPWLLVVAGVAVLIAGAGGYYVWKQLERPPLASVPPGTILVPPPGPPPQPIASPTQPAAVAQAPAPAIPGSVGPTSPPAPREPEIPARTAKTDTRPLAGQLAPPASAKPAPAAAATRRAEPELQQQSPGFGIKVKRTEVRVESSAQQEAAYRALATGDLDEAERRYQALVAANPTDRDALLGLAAVAVRKGNDDAALGHYRRVLELNPRDAMGIAGVIGLYNNLDAGAVESRLKNLLSGQPDAAVLHFSLGNQYAAQSRWSEAQRSYFNALSAEPENADYAYNVGVSFDHLRQSRLALQYYRRAIELAAARPATFDLARAKARADELGR